MPIALAHRLARRLAAVRKECVLPYLRPDGKTQVTLEYVDGKAVHANTIVVSSQHHPSVDHAQIAADLREHVIRPVIPAELFERLKEYLAARNLKQKQFLVQLIENALDDTEAE